MQDLEAALEKMSPSERAAKWKQIEELQTQLRSMSRSVDLSQSFGGMGDMDEEDRN